MPDQPPADSTAVVSALPLVPPAAPRSTSDRLGTLVVTQLADDIVGGRFAAGSTLPTEADLGKQFGVSRTVVRESVQLLQDKGLVLIRRGVGTVVCGAESWDMIDDVVLEAMVRNDDSLGVLDELVVVRAALEGEMAGAAAVARTADQVTALQGAYDSMVREAGDVAAFAAADVAFHDIVMAASGNRLGRAIVTSIHGKARTTGRYVGATSPVFASMTLDEHRRILDAVTGRDEVGASAAMRDHIVGSWSRRRPARSAEAADGPS